MVEHCGPRKKEDVVFGRTRHGVRGLEVSIDIPVILITPGVGTASPVQRHVAQRPARTRTSYTMVHQVPRSGIDPLLEHLVCKGMIDDGDTSSVLSIATKKFGITILLFASEKTHPTCRKKIHTGTRRQSCESVSRLNLRL